MKFTVSMKAPDALHYAIDALEQDEDEKAEIRRLARKWFQYDEYLRVEIDTEAQTCTVLPAPK